MPALNNCIREVRSADHYTCDRTRWCARYLKNVPQGSRNAASNILGSWSLDFTDHLKAIHQDSICIGTTYVNADSNSHFLSASYVIISYPQYATKLFRAPEILIAT